MISVTWFVFLGQFSLREANVERDEQRASDVVVLVVWHAFVLLGDASAGPRYLAAFYHNLVSIEMLYLHCEASQSVDQSNRHIRVQVVTTALKQRMSDNAQ